MKRREFIRGLLKEGCFLYRHGSKHDLYYNPKTGNKAPIPRHKEIKEQQTPVKLELIRKLLLKYREKISSHFIVITKTKFRFISMEDIK